jgi:hypothetical protein
MHRRSVHPAGGAWKNRSDPGARCAAFFVLGARQNRAANKTDEKALAKISRMLAAAAQAEAVGENEIKTR